MFFDILVDNFIKINGKQLTKIIVGPSNNITFKSEETNICVIQRNGGEYSYWKRYKGGAKGELWIDDSGKNNFKKLIELNGNLSSPIWVQDKIYFLSVLFKMKESGSSKDFCN